jgi:hypothetical protein
MRETSIRIGENERAPVRKSQRIAGFPHERIPGGSGMIRRRGGNRGSSGQRQQ